MYLTLAPDALYADETVQGGFTFRRVVAPTPGETRRRITVQIDPAQQAAAWNTTGSTGYRVGDIVEDIAVPEPDLPRTPQVWGWFWDVIKPDLSASGPGRLEAAVTLLANPPPGESVQHPRLQDLQVVATAHGLDILRATIGTEVSPALVLAVIGIESAGRVDAISPAGAAGLMQLMPATAARFGVSDRADPVENINGGVAYLNWLMKEFNGDPLLVLAAYNAGENAVRNNGGVPPYAETRAYVPKVLAAWSVARGLCVTPPELISDGCVFNVNQVGPNG